MTNIRHRQHLEEIFRSAVAAVQPQHLIPAALSLEGDSIRLGENIFGLARFHNIYVAGAGKATASMAVEVERVLGSHITDGVIAVKSGHTLPLTSIRSIEAGHPFPDAGSLMAAQEITKLLKKAGSDDLIIFLLSGGASSLMTDLPGDCTLTDINHAFRLLVNSGASIHEMNAVRKHLSILKGGGIARLSNGATFVSFVISDVIGDDLSVIGSGPAVADPSTFAEAMQVIKKYGLGEAFPPPVLSYLERGLQAEVPETPKEGDMAFANCSNYIIGNLRKALQAAADKASGLGYSAKIVTHELDGPVEAAAGKWSETVCSVRTSEKSCLIAGGETTVRVTGNGRGGRNQQFALAAAIAFEGRNNVSLLAAGTDGTDGPTDAAGAIIDGLTCSRAKSLSLSPEEHLHNHNAYPFFEATGELLKTGPTQTNVMDIVITLIN